MTTELRLFPSERQAHNIVETLQVGIDKVDQLSSVHVTFVYKDGSTNSLHSELPSVSTMVGAIERAKHRLIRESE